ncbi:hypothetical protein SLOPH_1655 [Spraguea lophii 42_110]|uniref:Exoribonuclease phosphorolytic domain-containing protein n=1 Tax=Spraguea lophii (strain 42_110) TaxID=1358809 RepID=S7WD21_SPRLO|nr:hypothetical protein SLOPH_1655 [Spraguea lophii 42_110]
MIECKTDIFNGVLGSSEFSYNDTKIYCSIVGFTTNKTKEFLSGCSLDIKWVDKTSVNTNDVSEYFSENMKDILIENLILDNEKDKILKIEFFVMSGGENILYCAVNSLFLSIVDAGIPIKNCFLASSSFSKEEEVFVYKIDDCNYEMYFFHAFDSLGDKEELIARENIESTKEQLFFCLKEKFNIEVPEKNLK